MAFFSSRRSNTNVATTTHVENCSCDQCSLSQTQHNLIVFAHGSEDQEVCNHALMATATGLARLGSTVCVINHPDLTRGQVGAPLETNEKNLYSLTSSAGKKGKDMTVSVNVLMDMCKQFDYVLMADQDPADKSPTKYDGAAWGLVAGRFILVNRALDQSSPIANKSYGVIVSDDSERIFLSINEHGVPEAYEHWDTQIAPEGIEMPLIAALWKDADPVPFAQAVIGIGDPLYYYVEHKSRKKVIKTAYAVQTLQAGAVKAYSATAVAGGAGAGWLLSLLYGQPSLVLVGLGVPAGYVLTAYLRTFINRHKVAGRKAVQNRTVERVYPSTNKTQIRLAIAAPILGTDSSSALYSSEMVWAKIRERHEEVQRRWNAYELDITKMLDAPLITDYSCPQTARLVKAANKAKEALVAAEEGNTGRGVATTRGLYADAVGELEIAFEVAEAHAIKQGIRGFAEAEQKKINRSRRLFALASDTGASDAERAQAIKQARKELDGIILIPERAVQTLLETSRLRPMLESVAS